MTHNRKQKVATLVRLLDSGSSISDACRQAGVGRKTAWVWRRTEPRLEEAIQRSLDRRAGAIEDVAMRNALDPDPRHNVLRIFLLKVLLPELYRENREYEERAQDECVRVYLPSNGRQVKIARDDDDDDDDGDGDEDEDE